MSAEAEIRVGQFVVFKDNPECSGVVFEFQDDGMVAGLKNCSQKLQDMGVGEETHEPCENLKPSSEFAIGDKVYLKGDGEAFSGTIFEFQDDGMVAGLSELSAKLTGLGCGEQTHEPCENLAMLAAE